MPRGSGGEQAAQRRRVPTLAMLAGLVAAAALAVFVGWPVALVVGRGLASDPALLSGGWLLAVLLRSLGVAALSTVLAVTAGSVLAYALSRADTPGRHLLSSAIRVPMVLPPFFASLALILVFGDGGLVARLFGVTSDFRGARSIVIAQVATFLPQAFLIVARALREADGTLEEVAENLGARQLAILRHVTFGLVRPALISSTLIVFVLCLSDFANPFLIGGGFRVLTTEIYARAAGGRDPGGAAALGSVLLASCLVPYVVNRFWIRAAPRPSRWMSTAVVGRHLPAAARWLLVAVAVGGAATLAGLYVGVALASLVGRSGAEWTLSLRHYRSIANAAGVTPLVNSVRLALLAAGIGSVLAVVIGGIAARTRPPGARVIEEGSLLPTAVPGIVLGLGYVLAWTGPSLEPTGGIWILVASVVFLKLPIGVLTAKGVIGRIDPSLEEAARSLGAGPLRTLFLVTVPYLGRAAAATFVDFFIDGITTVSALVLLASPGVTPGAVEILMRGSQGDLGLACALGTILGALAFAAILAGRRSLVRAAG